MSKAPPSPSFRPPNNIRLKGTMPRLSSLSLSPNPPPSTPSKDEISPVRPLGPSLVLPVDRRSPSPELKRKKSSEPVRNNSDGQTIDNDIYALDDDGWSRVANSGGIEEMLRLGEGASGSVSKCRLRKSGQVFAIKVCTIPIILGYDMLLIC
jgi:hypothetical protein